MNIAPECEFANGQLSSHIYNTVEENWTEMHRFIGYIKRKRKHKLIIKKPRELMTVSYCDSGYGDCNDTRKITM